MSDLVFLILLGAVIAILIALGAAMEIYEQRKVDREAREWFERHSR